MRQRYGPTAAARNNTANTIANRITDELVRLTHAFLHPEFSWGNDGWNRTNVSRGTTRYTKTFDGTIKVTAEFSKISTRHNEVDVKMTIPDRQGSYRYSSFLSFLVTPTMGIGDIHVERSDDTDPQAARRFDTLIRTVEARASELEAPLAAAWQR